MILIYIILMKIVVVGFILERNCNSLSRNDPDIYYFTMKIVVVGFILERKLN